MITFRTLFRQSRTWLAVCVANVACNSLFDIEKPTHAISTEDALICAATTDCTAGSGQVCLFNHCSTACTSDAECPSGKRCLRTDSGTACVAQAGTGCNDDQACPGGTICRETTCYDSCMSVLDCVHGEVCADAVCKTTLSGTVSSAGAGSSEAGAGGTVEVGTSGDAGVAATSGAGGSGVSGAVGSGGHGNSGGGTSAGGTSAGGTSGSTGAGTGGALVCPQPNLMDCDGRPETGCETNINSSKANCGGCSQACQDNQTTSNPCSGGQCIPTCVLNHADCDGIPSNGCETPTAADGLNCGGCGIQCKTQNATGTICTNGGCVPTCSSGFAACSNPAAGCTTSIDTATHCGNCATACNGGTPFCVSRVCAAHLTNTVVNSNTQGTSTTSGQSLIIQHTLMGAAGTYRLVVVGVTGFGNGAASLPAGLQYNGVAMTLAKATPAANNVASAIYYINDAGLPASPGTYNVIVQSSGGNSFVLTGNVTEFSNVEQATGAVDAVGGTATGNSCTAHPVSDTVTVSGSGEIIFSVAAVYGQANDMNANSSGQVITEQTSVSSLGTVAGYLVSPPVGTRTISWGLSSCSASAQTLVSIKPTVTP